MTPGIGAPILRRVHHPGGAPRLRAQHKILEDCRATYDELASEYDHHLETECGYRSPDEVAEVVVGLGGSGRWLDLGAGTGLIGHALHRRGQELELVALDLSASMLERARCPLYVEHHRVDVLRRIPGRERFDGAVASGLMEYVVNVPALLHRVASRIRVGGWFVFTFCPSTTNEVEAFDPEIDLHAHDVGLVERCAREAGFEPEVGPAFEAYVNGEQGWVRHRVVVARRC